MRQISSTQLDDIALGAAVLGTGGGGDPSIGMLMAQGTLRRRGPVDLLEPLDLADDDLVIPSAMMGAPTVMVEKIPGAAGPKTPSYETAIAPAVPASDSAPCTTSGRRMCSCRAGKRARAGSVPLSATSPVATNVPDSSMPSRLTTLKPGSSNATE